MNPLQVGPAWPGNYQPQVANYPTGENTLERQQRQEQAPRERKP